MARSLWLALQCGNKSAGQLWVSEQPAGVRPEQVPPADPTFLFRQLTQLAAIKSVQLCRIDKSVRQLDL